MSRYLYDDHSSGNNNVNSIDLYRVIIKDSSFKMLHIWDFEFLEPLMKPPSPAETRNKCIISDFFVERKSNNIALLTTFDDSDWKGIQTIQPFLMKWEYK